MVFNALRFWWKWTVPTAVLLALGAGAVVFWTFEPKYEAVALLQIRDTTPFLAFAPEREERGSEKRFVRTQIELLRSQLVLGPALASSKIRLIPEIVDEKDRIRALAEYVKVSSLGDSELYRVAVASSDPQAATATVNAVVGAYLQLHDQDEASRQQEVIKLLDEETANRRMQVQRARKKLLESVGNAGLSGAALLTENGPHLTRHPIADLRERLTAAEVEKEVTAARLEAARKLVPTDVEVPASLVAEEVERDPEVGRLIKQLNDLRGRRHETALLVANPARDASCIRLDEDIRHTEQTLNTYRQQLRQKAKFAIRDRLHNERQGAIANLANELQSLEKMVDVLSTEYKNQLAEFQGNTGESLENHFQMAELARAEEVLDRISSRAIALLTERRAPERIHLRHEAREPSEPVEAVPIKKMVAVMGVAFLLPFAIPVFWERLARRISDPENLQKNTRMDVVGEISHLPVTRIGGSQEKVQTAVLLFEESVDALRTNLVLSPKVGELRILAVTSAVNSEGKTSVATQLSRSIGRANRTPVLLIDGDLRSPDLHDIFDTPLEPGLAEVLAGECPFGNAVHELADPYVRLMPAGVPSENIHALFANGHFHQFLDEANQHYRTVVIDTPPVLAASEALIMAAAADGVLVCAMQNISRADQVKKACARLSGAGVRSLGTVLNGVPCRQYASRNGYYAYAGPGKNER